MKAISEVIYRGAMIHKAKNACIFLHGRGGNARGMLELADRLCGPDSYIAAPQATNHTWYPYSFLSEESLNEPFLSASIEEIKSLIDETAKIIPKERIYLIGFSQGACLSLEISTRFATRYGGIVAFTGGLIGKSIDESKYHGQFENTKVFISNGDHDPHIPLERSEQSKVVMEKHGALVDLIIYPGRPHTVLEEEIAFVKKQWTAA